MGAQLDADQRLDAQVWPRRLTAGGRRARAEGSEGVQVGGTHVRKCKLKTTVKSSLNKSRKPKPRRLSEKLVEKAINTQREQQAEKLGDAKERARRKIAAAAGS